MLLTTGRIGFEAARDDGRLVVVDGSQLPPHVEHGEAHAEPAATTAPDAGIETDTETFGRWFKGVWPPSLK